ncbi:tyrosine-type recombinase/integrase [Bacillus sp. Marseille-P3661]|uniref:tyrosine-type recombinase/integrase n=1 Tax=Bacillus sp. Marseille-P3661 TaxID=1936234 RepID=UPI000C85BD42|nr:tyrosine-type recombinase/integrase [Bacillus sp. Marseille-P3661]
MKTVEAIKDFKQLREMKNYLSSRSSRDYCLFLLGINTGIRLQELLNIHVKDVMSETGGISPFILSTIHHSPPVYLNENVRKAIQNLIQDSCLTIDDYLFKSRKTNEPITRQQAYRIINEAAKQADIEGSIGTHTLRKTFGYHAYCKGIAISLIQKRLQHSSPSETIHYIGLQGEKHLQTIILDVNL